MTGLVRKATLLTVCGLILAGAAVAGVPTAANSKTACVTLADLSNSQNNVGVNPGVCSEPGLVIIVRDALNNVVAGSSVVLDFTACPGWGTTIKLATTQADPAVTTSCAGKTLLKTSNALGQVCFSAQGGTNVNDPSSGYVYYTGLTVRNLGPNDSTVCVKIYASGQLLGTRALVINKYDLDNSGFVTAGDGGYHLDAQGFTYRTFADYNCATGVNAGDGALHLDAQGNDGPEVVYGGTYCP